MVFSIFSRKTKEEVVVEEVVSESEDEVEVESEEEEDIFGEPLETQQWGSDVTVSYYFKQIRDLAPCLDVWKFNRGVNKEHKDNLKKELLESIEEGNPHLMGSIQLVRDQDRNYRVINGQHRLKAIWEVLEEYPDPIAFKMKVMLEVYDLKVENFDSMTEEEEELVDRFYKTANKALNFKQEEDHEVLCKAVVKGMMTSKIFSRSIVDKNEGRVNRPRISAKQLFEELKTHLPVNVKKFSVSKIVEGITNINKKLSLMTHKELFGRESPSVQKQKSHEKAVDLGFFLNLDSKYPPSVWATMVYNEI